MADTKIPDPGPLSEKDMTYVQDGEGNVQPDMVPKHWVGTDLLPPGYKAATRTQAKKAAESAPPEPPAEPPLPPGAEPPVDDSGS